MLSGMEIGGSALRSGIAMDLASISLKREEYCEQEVAIVAQEEVDVSSLALRVSVKLERDLLCTLRNMLRKPVVSFPGAISLVLFIARE